jgi:hypothetical protein
MSKIQAMLPSGMTVDQAATGFRNQGQFIAALHASQNLGVPFADLKKQMVDNHLSLGQSIHTMNHSVDSTGAATQAEKQATIDINATGTTTSGTTTSTTTSTSTPTKKSGKK